MKRVIVIFLLLSTLHISVFCTYLEEAKELLLENKRDEAIPLFEKAMIEEPSNEEVYIDLGYIYELMKKWDKALEIYKKGLLYASEYKHFFYLNMGNIHYVLGRNKNAVEMFTKSIEHNSQFAEPYLNRAQAKLKLAMMVDSIDERVKSYVDIIKDYETYLGLKPDASERTDIEKMIAILRRFIKDKEQREKDLEDLLDILNSTSTGTKDITAGAEDIEVEYEDEDILD